MRLLILGESSGAAHSLFDKLRQCGATLQQWNREKFGNVTHRIKSLKEKKSSCYRRTPDLKNQQLKRMKRLVN